MVHQSVFRIERTDLGPTAPYFPARASIGGQGGDGAVDPIRIRRIYFEVRWPVIGQMRLTFDQPTFK